MASAKIFVLLSAVCLVVRAHTNADICSQEIRKFVGDIDQEMAQMQQQMQAMTPVLKDFVWHTFELEHQVRDMRSQLAGFKKSVEPSQPAAGAAVPEQNAGHILFHPGQKTIGVIGGKLSSLLAEANNNDLVHGTSGSSR